MIKKHIELPLKIDEFYVDNVKDAPDNFEYNEEEIKIFLKKLKELNQCLKI